MHYLFFSFEAAYFCRYFFRRRQVFAVLTAEIQVESTTVVEVVREEVIKVLDTATSSLPLFRSAGEN